MEIVRSSTLFPRRVALGEALSTAQDYISLTKPRVMSLLLISTCCPFILASEGLFFFADMLWLLLGGGLVTGSASAINCIWDRDIDQVMSRTQSRPLPSGRISLVGAALFSFLLACAGLLVLAWAFNVQTASAALFGHLFYTIVYTMWLKRTTPQNIVIGGAAGAVPPVVGWVAATGQIELTAVLLFLLVFLWTPPHFWALAINKNEDYTKAGVPMMPVVAGERATHEQMLFYAVSLIPVSLLLVLSNPNLGLFTTAVVVGSGVVFAWKNWELMRLIDGEAERKRKKAWDVFGFSLIYLSVLFLSLVIDSALI